MAKFGGAKLLLNLVQVTESISGSVVPLAMFLKLFGFPFFVFLIYVQLCGLLFGYCKTRLCEIFLCNYLGGQEVQVGWGHGASFSAAADRGSN